MTFFSGDGLRQGLMALRCGSGSAHSHFNHEVTLVVNSSAGNQQTHLEPIGAFGLK